MKTYYEIYQWIFKNVKEKEKNEKELKHTQRKNNLKSFDKYKKKKVKRKFRKKKKILSTRTKYNNFKIKEILKCEKFLHQLPNNINELGNLGIKFDAWNFGIDTENKGFLVAYYLLNNNSDINLFNERGYNLLNKEYNFTFTFRSKEYKFKKCKLIIGKQSFIKDTIYFAGKIGG